MKTLIARNAKAFERAKTSLRKLLPVTESRKVALSKAASRVHQRYFQDFAFIHINKCGGTSLTRALGIPLLHHDTALERRKVLGAKVWDQRFTFTMVRNPYDRILSLYFYRNRHSEESLPTLLEGLVPWLEERAEAVESKSDRFGVYDGAMTSWVTDETGALMVDEYFRLEELDACTERLSEKLGRPIEIKRLKARRHTYNRDAILEDPRIRQLIETIVEPDFEMFAYSRI